MRSVLFAQYTAQTSGSPVSGLMIAEGLKGRGWQIVSVLGVNGDLLERYRQTSSHAIVAPHGQWLSGGTRRQAMKRWWREIGYRRQFAQLIQEIQPDVVYVNTLMGLAPAWAARQCGVPCIWHIRELFDDVGGEMRPPWPGGKKLVAFLLEHCADAILCISEAVRDNLIDARTFTKTMIVPNAVDDIFFTVNADRAECCRGLGLDPREAIIGVPATLRPVKGLIPFLDAAAILISHIPGLQFAVTGDGLPGYKVELQLKIKEVGLQGNVRFLGSIADMPRFYRACDVICVPSRSESFGRGAAEAFACGVPVVASAVGGLKEIVADGITGLLVEYGNPQQLADALLKLLQQPDYARQLAANARRKAETEFRAAVYQERIAAIVNDVVNRRTGSKA